MPVFDLARMLAILDEERVQFIVVGGVAAALQGAPVLTQDVDIQDAPLTRTIGNVFPPRFP